MKKNLSIMSVIATAVMMIVCVSCKKDNGEPKGPERETVTDACDNTYHVVKIGEQYWMAENLRCNKYDTQSEAYNASWLKNNTIPKANKTEYSIFTPIYADASDLNNWRTSTYAYNLTKEQVAMFGYVYNWAAIVGVEEGRGQIDEFKGNRQGICPNGWHVPSEEECQILYDYIYKEQDLVTNSVAKYLKTKEGWRDGFNGTDSYGFAALPVGVGDNSGLTLSAVGASSFLGTSTPCGDVHAYYYMISGHGFEITTCSKNTGFSVRCLKN